MGDKEGPANSQDALKFLSNKMTKMTDSSLQSEWAQKKLVWVPDAESGFQLAQMLKEDPSGNCLVKLVSSGKEVQAETHYRVNPPKFDKEEDMANLTWLNEAAVLHNLTERYHASLIYTYSGLFCVVINPYRNIPIYTESAIELYKGRKRHEVPPHVYAITDSAYRSMLHDKEDQAILCTGESGAGKTENTKKVIQYLAAVASHKSSTGRAAHGELEKQLLQCNPLLEAFGNAKTVKNDNSSRFGKFIRINFDSSGFIAGANIETYLLEKARVIRQAPEERTFHIFYQMLQGAGLDYRNELLLDNINNYKFLSFGDVSINGQSEQEEFNDTLNAMSVLNVPDEDVRSCLRVVSAVLHFGNMEFKKERGSDQATMPNNTVAQKVCQLLKLDLNNFTRALLRPRIKVGREFVNKAQTKDECDFVVEALSKALYEKLFQWIVSRVNKSLDRTTRQGSSFLGILDIAGFEIFEMNNFEQLCINYTNEKLQQLFNHTMFILEQEEYQREGIEWKFIDFGLDLQPCIELIESPSNPPGILALLDEECWMPKATDKTFVEKLYKQQESHPKFQKPKLLKGKADFIITHYAGNVEYKADNWLTKNQDPLNDNVTKLMSESPDPFVASLWRDAKIVGMDMQHQNDSPFGGGVRARKGGMFRTVGALYKDQLNRLMTTLRNTNPNFVRCIIPNYNKRPGVIHPQLVLEQLRCNGVLEGIRICRQGFPNRIPFQEFRQRYEVLTPGIFGHQIMDSKKACTMMLENMDLEAGLFRVGQSKIFFRSGVLAHLEEERDVKICDMMVRLQAVLRGYLARSKFSRKKDQQRAIRVIQRNGLSYLKLRNWQWWRLFTKVKPLLQAAQTDELMNSMEKKIEAANKEKDKVNEELNEKMKNLEKIMQERDSLEELLEQADAAQVESDSIRRDLFEKKTQLEDLCAELESKLDEEEEKNIEIRKNYEKTKAINQELEEQLEEEETARQKLELEKAATDKKLKELGDENMKTSDKMTKLAREKAALDARLNELQQNLSGEEGRSKALEKAKAKYEGTIAELDERLKREEKARIEKENSNRRLNSELDELRERVAELERTVEDLQNQLSRKDDEISQLQDQLDHETAERQKAIKEIRALTNQNQELKEDLDAEKMSRQKSDKNRRDLQEELESLKAEVDDGMEHERNQNEVRIALETKMSQYKGEMDLNQAAYEKSLAELRSKNNNVQEKLAEEIEMLRRQKASAEKQKNAIDNEAKELSDELSTITQAKNDADAKRRRLEANLQEANARLQDAERVKTEQQLKITRLEQDYETLYATHEDTDCKASQLNKEVANLETLLADSNAAQHEENQAKLRLQSRLRQLEEDRASMEAQLEDQESGRDALQHQNTALNNRLTERQKRIDELDSDKSEAVEKLRRKERDLEDIRTELDDQKLRLDNAERNRIRLQADFDDVHHELENQRNLCVNLEKKQRQFDKQLTDERQTAAHRAEERDQAQSAARAAEAKVFSLTREIEELNERIEEVERQKRAQAAELEELASSQDGKQRNVHDLEKAKRTLEAQVEELRTQMDELEDDLQLTEDAKLRLEVNLQAEKARFEREIQGREEGSEEKRRTLQRQLRELEEELDEERKSRTAALNAKKKLEIEVTDLTNQNEGYLKSKDDLSKQLAKMQRLLRDLRNENEEVRAEKDQAQAAARDAEKKAKNMEGDLAQANDDLMTSERLKRAAQSERDDLSEENAALARERNTAQEEKRRLEGRINEVEEEKEEVEMMVDEGEERNRRLNAQLDEAQSELSLEKSRSKQNESAKIALEKSNKELRQRLAEYESEKNSKVKAELEAVRAKLAAAEDERDQEQRARYDLSKQVRRADKKIKDALSQADEERRQHDALKEQLEKLNSRLRASKRQADEAEEETARIQGLKRKVQRDLDEANETVESLQRELANQRNKARLEKKD